MGSIFAQLYHSSCPQKVYRNSWSKGSLKVQCGCWMEHNINILCQKLSINRAQAKVFLTHITRHSNQLLEYICTSQFPQLFIQLWDKIILIVYIFHSYADYALICLSYEICRHFITHIMTPCLAPTEDHTVPLIRMQTVALWICCLFQLLSPTVWTDTMERAILIGTLHTWNAPEHCW